LYKRREENAVATKWYKDINEDIVCERVLACGVALVETFNLCSERVTERLVNLTLNSTMSSRKSKFEKDYLNSLVDIKSIKRFEK